MAMAAAAPKPSLIASTSSVVSTPVVYSAPAVQYAAPAVRYAAPAVSYSSALSTYRAAAPVVSYGVNRPIVYSLGSGYGTYGYYGTPLTYF